MKQSAVLAELIRERAVKINSRFRSVDGHTVYGLGGLFSDIGDMRRLLDALEKSVSDNYECEDT